MLKLERRAGLTERTEVSIRLPTATIDNKPIVN